MWLHSPYIAIPLTLILIAAVAVFVFGGKSAANNIINLAKNGAKNFVTGMTTRAATQMLKKDWLKVNKINLILQNLID